MPTIDEDLTQLEHDIRLLKIEFEQFFGGGRKRPPADTQWRADLLIRRYAERGADLNYSQRFRYNNLAQTYAKYQEIWRKRMRQKEEGRIERHFGAAARLIEEERRRRSDGRHRDSSSHPVIVACSDPDREAVKVEELYRALVAARAAVGEVSDEPSLDDFREFVCRKTAQLKQAKGSSAVEFEVSVAAGRVKLKARTRS